MSAIILSCWGHHGLAFRRRVGGGFRRLLLRRLWILLRVCATSRHLKQDRGADERTHRGVGRHHEPFFVVPSYPRDPRSLPAYGHSRDVSTCIRYIHRLSEVPSVHGPRI